MDLGQNGLVECNFEFWPIEHPTEPPDEDQPVKCPMPPNSSVINEERFSDSMRKRTEVSATIDNEGMVVVGPAAKPPARTLRKRHYSSTRADHHALSPLSRMPPLHPLPSHNLTISQMLQQFNKFES